MKNKKYEKYLKIAFSLHLVDFLLTCFRVFLFSGFPELQDFQLQLNSVARIIRIIRKGG